MSMQVLTVSTKGQVSIPVDIRKNLSITTGDKLVAYTTGDLIVLKPLTLPTEEEIMKGLDNMQNWAKSVGYKETDVNNIIKSIRTIKNK